MSGRAATDRGARRVGVVVAWDRGEAGLVSRHDILRRYSVQHITLGPKDRALCGTRVPWLYLSPGDSRRCLRCFRLAAMRGMVDQWGEPFVADHAGAPDG